VAEKGLRERSGENIAVSSKRKRERERERQRREGEERPAANRVIVSAFGKSRKFGEPRSSSGSGILISHHLEDSRYLASSARMSESRGWLDT
jgi:hypothetical protein